MGWFMRILFVIALFLVGRAYGQDATLSYCDAQGCELVEEVPATMLLFPPQNSQRDDGRYQGAPAVTPEKHCGPHWLGGCFDIHRPMRPAKETLKDPWFAYLAAALYATNAADVWKQQSKFRHGQVDQNGKQPSWGSQSAVDFSADTAVTTMAFFMKRKHIKVIPELMMIYGIVIHTKSAIE